MKKLLSSVFSSLKGRIKEGLLFLALFTSVSAIYASDTKVHGIWYDFDSSTNTASVTYQGSASDSYEAEYSGLVVIPENVTYNGTTYSVTSIGNYAFEDCSSLTSVTIPNSVTSIGNSAFYECFSLTSVTIPNSVTSIGEWAFYYCSSLTSITIPNSVTSIGFSAFEKCYSLTKTNYTGDIAGWCNIWFGGLDANPISQSHNFYINDQEIKDLVIPNNVTSIGNYAFNSCSSLTSVTIPNSVTSIGGAAFNSCSSLTSVTIPNSVTSIGNSAFYECFSLTSVTIPNSVISIGDNAFRSCSSLTSVTIPNSVISIGDNAFRSCSSLTFVTIPNSVTSIGGGAFSGCTSLTSITIPNSVTSIGEWAFYYCSSLTSVTIPNSVTSIGDDPFYGCSSLTAVTLTANSVEEFCQGRGNVLLYNAGEYGERYIQIDGKDVVEITIPNSITSIGDSAFIGCSSLTSVTIGESVTSIGSSAFNSCSSLTSVTIGESVTSIGSSAFNNCSSLTSVTIPNSVTSIGSSVFRNCSSLTSVTIGESVTSIGESAFEDCSSLTSVTIPNSVSSIGDYAFDGCSSLTSVTIGNSVTSIGYSAFRDCSSLTSVTIGNSVTSIGYYAFRDCSSLTSVTCEAVTPPTLGSDAFYRVSISIPVYVPCGCVEAYKTASGWKDFTKIQLVKYSIEVDVNDTRMGSAKVDWNRACDTQISAIPNIGYHFIQWNDGNTDAIRTLELTHDTILTAEFAQSFSGQCGDNLYWSYDETTKTVSITGSGKMYDYTATTQPWLLFKEQIVEVTPNNTVTSIGTSAFEGCVRLAKISLGTGLEEIATNAFAGCTRLYDIYVYATYPPFADESSFANYNVYVYIPCEYQRDYILDVVWGKFKFIECLESEDVTTDGNVTIVPSYNDVTITWPTEDNADTYTIIIKNGDEVFCTLTFNSEGQLLNIAFAPGRDGNRPAQYAEQAVNGYRFTITGLTEATRYAYSVTTKDAANQTIATYSGEFTTMGDTTTAVEDILQNTTNVQKLLRNGQLIIVRDGVEYNAMGQEIGN